MTSVKTENLASRCVSEHPSFADLGNQVLLSSQAVLGGGDESMTEESFSLSVVREQRGETSEAELDAETAPTIPQERRYERRVSFTSLEIREYSVVPGSHPQCSSGCPIELGWEYQSSSEHSLDHYEAARHPRRPRDQLRLSVEERESLLSANGQEHGEVRRAARRHHRSKSCEGRYCQRNMQTFFQK